MKSKQTPNKDRRKIRNCVVVSDTHAGCGLALCPPEFKRDEGGIYKASKVQLVLWNWWNEFWREWVPLVTRGEPWDLVLNGDTIEGVHHKATTQITHNNTDQRKLAVEILRPVVAMCHKAGGRFFIVRGTSAHVGESAENEEAVAKELEAVPNEDGQYSRYELWKRVGDGLVHFLHHVGTTSSSAHESSAVNAELAAEFVEAARWNEEPPQVIVRSHRHRNIEIRVPTARGFATATVTPAWQLRTPFAFKIPGARLAPPQIGGLLIRAGDRALYTDPWVRHLSRGNVE